MNASSAGYLAAVAQLFWEVTVTIETGEFTVGTFNIERFGYDPGHAHHRLPGALDWLLEQTPTPPDILALPEATRGLDDGQHAIRRLLIHRLAPHLTSGWYEPLFSSRPVHGRRNHLFLLLVNTAVVRPLEWHDPGRVDPVIRYDGFAVCDVFGHEVNICSEHWPGGSGREAFVQSAQRVSTWATKKTLLLGDFNADSGWEPELHHQNVDWFEQCQAQGNLNKLWQKGWLNPATGRWEIDTRQIDMLRTIFEYRDMGEQFGDPTPTTNPKVGSGLRIDRIFHSAPLPLEVADYQVRQPPRRVSDHGYVFARCRVPILRPGTEQQRVNLD